MKGNVMKREKSKLAYETPELTVTKVKMETEFLIATSMMTGSKRMQATIVDFDSSEDAPDFNGSSEDGDITLTL
jgi:hypothetical protein